MESHFNDLGIINSKEEKVEEYPNPYAYELNHLSYPPFVLQHQAPKLYKSFEETPLVFIDTIEGLKELAMTLEGVNEFAIDLEVF